jgi:uncharacterized protein
MAMVDSEVLVAVRKYDGSLHWHHTMRRLGEDEHGVWLGAPSGTVYSRGDEGPIYASGELRIMLIPPDAWWTASFAAPPALSEIYCDVTTPSTWPHRSEVSMVDLDLDVWRTRPDGAVELLDEDEFAEHRVRYGYPEEVVARATATAGWLKSVLSADVEPFRNRYRHWLDRVC